MKRVIWLKTARVSGHNPDNTAKVERITNKLEDGDSFNKFIKYLNLKGMMTSEPPEIVKVMESKEGEWIVIDPRAWDEKLKEALKIPEQNEKIDFKALSEKQAKELDQVKANYNSLEERLKALENKPQVDDKNEIDNVVYRMKLETKANKLGIKFRENIGNDKLIAKIKEVEPEFEVIGADLVLKA